MLFDLCEQGNVLHNVNDVQGQIVVYYGYTVNYFSVLAISVYYDYFNQSNFFPFQKV